MQLNHLAGLRVGGVAFLRWSEMVDTVEKNREEIQLLSAVTKGRHARAVFISLKLRAELQVHADSVRCLDRRYPFFASQKSIKSGFGANSLAQTFALIYEAAGVDGASSHSGRRSFLTSLAKKVPSIHILKTLAGHRRISTSAVHPNSSPA